MKALKKSEIPPPRSGSFLVFSRRGSVGLEKWDKVPISSAEEEDNAYLVPK